MTERHRRPIALIVVLALLFLWMRSRRAALPRRDGRSTVVREAERPPATPLRDAPAPDETSPSPDAAAEASGSSSVAATPGDAADDHSFVEGVAVLEDGTPLPGVVFWFGQAKGHGKSPLSTVSGPGDGSFSIPRHRPSSVSHRTVAPVRAEGATLAQEEQGWTLRPHDGDGPLRLVFRDDPEFTNLRLLDASTGRPLPGGTVVHLLWRQGDWSIPWERTLDGRDDGWFDLPAESFAGQPGPAPEGAVVRLMVNGYATEVLPVAGLRGRRTLTLTPCDPLARGTLAWDDGDLPPEGADGDTLVECSMEPLDTTGGNALPMGLPSYAGPFALHGLTEGRWRLHVAVQRGTTPPLRASVEFTVGPGTAELGEVRAE